MKTVKAMPRTREIAGSSSARRLGGPQTWKAVRFDISERVSAITTATPMTSTI